MDEGVLVADGQLSMAARLKPGTGRLRLGRFWVQDGAEWMDIYLHLTSDDAFPASMEVALAAVRTRSVG